MSWTGKNIVAPYDFSPEALEGVKKSISLADAPQNVHVIFVLPELSPAEPGVIWNQVDDEVRKKHAGGQMREAFAEAGLPTSIVTYVELGDPGTEITELATRLEAGLIVMPSHGRRGFTRLFLGSVAERVIRLATCPVLIIKHR